MILKKWIAGILAVAIAASVAFVLFTGGEDEYGWVEFVPTEYEGSTLYVYNWGEYIADGSDDTLDLIKVFEKRYNITVVYDTFDSNETLYSRLATGAVTADVIFPSDYMAERLIMENYLQPIDFENIPNYEYIADSYKGLHHDPDDLYTVPYNVGMVGIVYNTEMISEEDAENASWELLWDPDYKNQVLIFDNSRDGFATALLSLGLPLNSTDPTVWDAAFEKLKEQRDKSNPGYVMDQVFQKMEGNNAAAAAYYAGDCLSMIEENESLAFYYPKEGTNVFIDVMCIPKAAQNKGAAELFINFLLEPEIAEENALYLYYASPNTAVIESETYKEALGEDAYALLYELPEEYVDDEGNLIGANYYYHLPQETINRMNELWSALKQYSPK